MNGRNRRSSFVLLALVATATPAGAEEPDEPATADEAAAGAARRIGLREALATAVKQNPSLASETIDVAIADAEIAQTFGLDDYVVSGEATWLSRRSEAVAGQPFQTTALDDFRLKAGIAKPLTDGGRVGVTFDQGVTRTVSHLDFMGMQFDSESTVFAPTLQVTFFQPILRGFGDKGFGVGSRSTRHVARAKRIVEDLEREGSAANLVRDVVQAYWELAYSAEELTIRRASLALAREQLRITQAGIELGKLARTDSLAVEQAIAVREEEVLLAEQAVSDRSLELRQLVGLEIGVGEIELVAADRLETGSSEPSLEESLKRARDRNPQLLTVRARGKEASILVEVNENGLLPQLDFSAAAGPSGNSDSFGDSYAQLGTFDSWQVNAGVTFTWNVGNRGAKGAIDMARGAVRKAKLTEADISAQISVQVVRAVNLVRVARKRMEVTAKATALAKQNVDVERSRWEVGKATNFDILKRQEELQQSQLREARASTDYLKAISVLEALTGDLLPRYGIELAKK